MLKGKWPYPKRAKARKRASTNPVDVVFPVLSGKRLLSEAHRQALLAEIRHYAGLPRDTWRCFYGVMLEQFAALVQELPASEYHHHARRGGLLDHSLEVCLNAMKLRQAEMLDGQGREKEDAVSPTLHTYAVCSAALLHDAGKVLSDVHPVIAKGNRELAWFPWMGVMEGGRYRVRFNRERQYAAHGDLGLLLAPLVVPVSGLNWIGAAPSLLGSWASAIIGRKDAADALSRIIQEADRLSVKRDLQAGQPLGGQRPLSIAKRFLIAVKTLIEEGDLILNRPGAVGWLADGTLWLVAKTSVDIVRAHCAERGQTDLPADNPRLFSLLQEAGVLIPNQGQAVWHCRVSDSAGWTQELRMVGIAADTLWAHSEQTPAAFKGSVELAGAGANGHEGSLAPTKPDGGESDTRAPPTKPTHSKIKRSPLGVGFVEWVKEGVRNGTLSVNEPTAKIHVVNGGVFLVSPGIFRDYLESEGGKLRGERKRWEAEGTEGWAIVQKAFQRLGLHRKTTNGQNIWTCKVKGARGSKLRGYWLEDGDLWAAGKMPPDNPHLLM